MDKFIKLALVAITLVFSSATMAVADFDDGLQAAQAGDFQTALNEWRPLAERGDAVAQFNLGIMYARGLGVPQDDAELVRWWQMAAEQGYVIAQYELGVLYDQGARVTQNYTEAVKWLSLAAQQGYASAQIHLGTLFENGLGVSQNSIAARMWYIIGAENGEELGFQFMGLMDKFLSQADKLTAQQLAQECMTSGYTSCEVLPAANECEGLFTMHVATSESIARLLNLGCDANTKFGTGITPLHQAVKEGRIEIVTLLLSAGADVNAATENGRTPLHWATSYNKPELVALLLKAGAKVDARTATGYTPIMDASAPIFDASMRGPLESLTALLDAGADVNASTSEGMTPLHWAAAFGPPEAVLLLLEAGADGSLETNDGKTPFDHAEDNEKVKGTEAYWALRDAQHK